MPSLVIGLSHPEAGDRLDERDESISFISLMFHLLISLCLFRTMCSVQNLCAYSPPCLLLRIGIPTPNACGFRSNYVLDKLSHTK